MQNFSEIFEFSHEKYTLENIMIQTLVCESEWSFFSRNRLNLLKRRNDSIDTKSENFFAWKYEYFPKGVHAVGRPPAYLNPIRIYIGFPAVLWCERFGLRFFHKSHRSPGDLRPSKPPCMWRLSRRKGRTSHLLFIPKICLPRTRALCERLRFPFSARFPFDYFFWQNNRWKDGNKSRLKW